MPALRQEDIPRPGEGPSYVQQQLRLAAFAQAARVDPAGTLIVLDVDGTVVPIAERPQDVTVGPTMRATLQRISERYRLWFMSGRDADEARAIVGVQSAGYVGSHGLEALDERGLRPLASVADAKQELERLVGHVLDEVPEVRPHVERKRWSVAFHYRAIPEVGERLERCITRHFSTALRLLPGKMVYEVLPVGTFDKGTALRWLLQTVAPHRVLAAGDDQTDMPMLQVLTASYHGQRLAIAVRHGPETPEGLARVADVAIDDLASLETILASLL